MEYLIILIFGLEVGSFANVCIYRWPLNKSILVPMRSVCPWCQHQIAWYDNLPVLSFLLLKARCRNCSADISWRYPTIEVGLSLLCLVFSFYLVPFEMSPTLFFKLSILFVVFTLVVTTMTDLDWKIIPDNPLLTLFFLGIIFSPWNPLLNEGRAIQSIQKSALGALSCAGVLLIISDIGKRCMGREVLGWGDIKLLGAMGAILGAESGLSILLVGSLVGGCITSIGLLLGIVKRFQYIPFAPFLNVGALTVLLIKVGSIYGYHF